MDRHHYVATHIIYHKTNHYKSTSYDGQEAPERGELPSITHGILNYAIFERNIEKHHREGHLVTFMIS
jgi:hypothetical protein